MDKTLAERLRGWEEKNQGQLAAWATHPASLYLVALHAIAREAVEKWEDAELLAERRADQILARIGRMQRLFDDALSERDEARAEVARLRAALVDIRDYDELANIDHGSFHCSRGEQRALEAKLWMARRAAEALKGE